MKRRWFATTLFLAGSIVSLAQQQQQSESGSARWRRIDDPAPSPRAVAAAQAPQQQQQQQDEAAALDPQDQQGPPPQQQQYPQQQQQRPMNPPIRPNGDVVIPAGTWINVRTDQFLSSEYNRAGDAFALTLSQPIVAGGFVLARRGQTVTGRVTDAIRAGKVKGTSRLVIELSELTLADGQQVPVRTQLVDFTAGSSRGQDTATIGATTGIGAAIGAAASGGFGAGMGAIAGAGASTIGVLLSRGRATEVPPESMMRFRLTEPVTVNTSQSAHAFQAVQQQDYENRGSVARAPQLVRRPAPVMYGGGWYPYYDPWFWGPGYGWGWGPGFYSTRVFVGGGWGRGWGRGWGGGWGGRRR